MEIVEMLIWLLLDLLGGIICLLVDIVMNKVKEKRKKKITLRINC